MKRMANLKVEDQRLLAVAALVFATFSGVCAASARYGGGSFDGFDRRDAQRTLGVPVVNNANGATNALPTSAWLNGTLVDTGTAVTAVSVYWGPTDGVTNKTAWTNRSDFGNCVAGQSLTTNVTGLAQNTTYYYRFYATNTAGDDAWADASASFLTPSSPVVTTNSGASSIGPRTATLNGILTAGGSATITLYWGQDTNNWSGVSNLGVRAQGVAFSNAVSGLLQGSLYYYRCYATNTYGDGWSAVASFSTTLAPARYGGGSYDGYDNLAIQRNMVVLIPTVDNAGGATNILQTSAWLNGTLVSTGAAATAVSVYWGPINGATNKAAWSNQMDFGTCAAGQSLTTNVIGLTASTPYYYRFYATNTAGYEAWADASTSFSTLGYTSPAVNNAGGATNLQPYSAWLNGTLVITGAAATAVSVYWGPTDGTTNKTSWSNRTDFGFCTAGQSLTTNVTGLTPNTPCYYRLYATNDAGYDAWADASSGFTTPKLPAVNNAGGATTVRPDNAWLNGTLTETGMAAAAVSVYWGPTDGVTNKTAWSNQIDFGVSGIGNLSTNIQSLISNTRYYYRFYATNTAGYDAWAIASTNFLTPTPPNVSTGVGATAVGVDQATLNGDLTAGVSATVVMYWGQDTNNWSTNANLGVRAQGPFSTTALNLQDATLYYYRCYATNAGGEAWSAIASFTTSPRPRRYYGGSFDGFDRCDAQRVLGLPVVNNAGGATNALPASAWLNGTLVDAGAAQAEVSVFWGPTDGVTNKTAWSNRCDFGMSSVGSFSTNIQSLTPNTQYYYRFYVTNDAVEAWADAAASFITPSSPVVTTNSGATAIGPRTATLNGILTAGDSATITLYWGQNTNAWSGNTNLGTRAQGVAFSAPASGLLQGSLYYYRCYATNAYGDGWSDIAAFTTTLAPARYSGGSYDGYDAVTAEKDMQVIPSIGTVFMFR